MRDSGKRIVASSYTLFDNDMFVSRCLRRNLMRKDSAFRRSFLSSCQASIKGLRVAAPNAQVLNARISQNESPTMSCMPTKGGATFSDIDVKLSPNNFSQIASFRSRIRWTSGTISFLTMLSSSLESLSSQGSEVIAASKVQR